MGKSTISTGPFSIICMFPRPGKLIITSHHLISGSLHPRSRSADAGGGSQHGLDHVGRDGVELGFLAMRAAAPDVRRPW